jgi:integrase
MTTPSVPAAGLVQAFFVDFLLNQKHASPRTLATYRDAFRLLLRFVHETHGVQPAALSIENLDAPIILAFLDHIERQRANCIRSRNARLAAVRSFFRFVQMREPAALAVASRVLAIPVKRTERKLVGCLTRPEIDALLSATDRTNWDGLLGNRYRQQKLARCRQLLGMASPESTIPKDYRDRYEELTGCSLRRCPICQHGCMVTIQILPAHRSPPIHNTS